MIVKDHYMCATCGRPVKVKVYSYPDKPRVDCEVEPCRHCVKDAYNSGHVEGRLHREMQKAKAKEKKR